MIKRLTFGYLSFLHSQNWGWGCTFKQEARGVKRQSGRQRLSWQPMVEFGACCVTAISLTWFKRLSGWSHLSFRSFFRSPLHGPFLTATCC